jgi:hypothetical protein
MMGRLSWSAAIESATLTVEGSQEAAADIPNWLACL